MKKSQLRQIIKEEIKSLKEDKNLPYSDENDKVTNIEKE
tara:strand:+ start:560 stop:676 length:117 start_codon:yes stop_codon:yes gene_type:complete